MAKCLSEQVVKTRKEHQCWGCARKFPKGTCLKKTNWEDMGTVNSSYWCPVCQYTISEVGYQDGDSCGKMGDVRANDAEVWEEIRQETEEAK